MGNAALSSSGVRLVWDLEGQIAGDFWRQQSYFWGYSGYGSEPVCLQRLLCRLVDFVGRYGWNRTDVKGQNDYRPVVHNPVHIVRGAGFAVRDGWRLASLRSVLDFS